MFLPTLTTSSKIWFRASTISSIWRKLQSIGGYFSNIPTTIAVYTFWWKLWPFGHFEMACNWSFSHLATLERINSCQPMPSRKHPTTKFFEPFFVCLLNLCLFLFLLRLAILQVTNCFFKHLQIGIVLCSSPPPWKALATGWSPRWLVEIYYSVATFWQVHFMERGISIYKHTSPYPSLPDASSSVIFLSRDKWHQEKK